MTELISQIELPIDDSGFMACITLHNILKTKKRGIKCEEA